jgi:hypothetical protein
MYKNCFLNLNQRKEVPQVFHPSFGDIDRRKVSAKVMTGEIDQVGAPLYPASWLFEISAKIV